MLSCRFLSWSAQYVYTKNVTTAAAVVATTAVVVTTYAGAGAGAGAGCCGLLRAVAGCCWLRGAHSVVGRENKGGEERVFSDFSLCVRVLVFSCVALSVFFVSSPLFIYSQ